MKRSGRPGFTLVEILVVIGVIAILAALLIPALKRVRQQAMLVSCAANERQLLAAFAAYVIDNEGATPLMPFRTRSEYFNQPGNTPAQHSLMYYMMPDDGGAGVVDFGHGPFWKYLGAAGGASDSGSSPRQQLFTCMVDLDYRAVATGGQLNNAGTAIRNFTYSWNVLMRRADPANGFPLADRLAKIQNAGHKIVLCEEERPNDGACFIGAGGSLHFGSGDDTPTFRHFGGGNWGFADGHVERLEPSELGYTVVTTDTQTAVQWDMSKVNYYFNLAAPY